MRSYQETLDYLYTHLPVFQRVGNSAYKKDLKNTLLLSEAIGNPHEKLPCIHVAGTNGKGSVSHILAAILQAHGYRVGIYSSPHYKDFRERIKINNKYISEQAVVDFTEKMKGYFETVKPSFFEATVVMAFDYFAKEKVDFAVIEVGLGGRLDSTNIITPLISVITNISYDHMDILGDTLEKIAGEKAGIIKPEVPVVIGETHPETMNLFLKISKEKNAPLIFADQQVQLQTIENNPEGICAGYEIKLNENESFVREYCSDLTGRFQAENIRTALAAIFVLKNSLPINYEKISAGILNARTATGLIGRFQVIHHNPMVICDSAHNEGGIRMLLKEIDEIGFEQLHIVFGTVQEKDLSKILPLLPKYAKYYFCKANLPRALDAQQLKEKAMEYELTGSAYANVAAAYEAALDQASASDLVVVTGSIFVVAEVV